MFKGINMDTKKIKELINCWLKELNSVQDKVNWLIENQMWIYGNDGNYVVYSTIISENPLDYSCDVYISHLGISIEFDNKAAIDKYIS